ncbi:MAG TPA: lamin tail domain-containing protein, partial [Verrucomicrobiae bacterium]|nr:lamin tail domain-containing protein [Verrucomicrobiae bacterium]
NGIYVLEEKIKIGKDRVNIDRLEPENATVPSVTGGYLMKVDRLDPGDSGFSGGGQIIAYVDPKERDLKTTQRLPQRNYLTQYFNSMSKALSAANWRDPVLGYAAYLDAQNWVDFNILEVLSLNVDAMRLSTYFYKPRNGKITYGPHWDFDRALGSTDGRDNNPRQWATSSQFTEVWWSRLFGDLDFWQRWVDRYQTWRQRELSTATLYGMIDDLTGQLRNAQPREQAKWHHPLRGGSYQSEINYSKAWLSNHCAFLDQQFVQMPKPNSAGGQVANRFNFTLTGPAAPAVVLYTLDGRDPRLAGGTISKLAVTNRNAIVISSNMIVTARAYNPANRQTAGGPAVNSIWSAPVTTVFTVEPPPLALTEIMFHPADPPVGSPFGKEDFEFLELKNISGHALDLPGYHFTNGIQFRFAATNSVTRLAPGERLLLVHNRLAFATRYAGVANIAGEYAGALSNGGNRLTLAGPLGEPVFDVEYGDQWEPLADGFGFSLVLADEAVPPNQWNQAASWRLSGAVGGSPGGVDRQASPVPRVLVNEALAHPSPTAGRADAIELYNDSPDTADISGWFLTDDFRAPRKFRIPDGTTIPARGYQVFTELQFATGGVTGFALDAQGDQAWLFAAEPGGNLRPWVHGFEFGASPAGESFGRWVTTTGEEHFVAQSQLTLGLSNAGPRLGPVILSEVMYNPPLDGVANNTLDEYVELRNVSTNNVSLFDPDHATNTWRLRGGIDFDFPSGTVLAPGSTLAVVSFDPAVNLGALANFRAHYHLTPGGTILGPWSGHLDNQSDGIQLLRPDVPVISSGSGAVKVPYVLVEEVNYTNEEPWPVTVSGTGLSLHRRDPLQYANDPASWSEGTPDPAAADSDNDGLPDAWEIANGLDPFSATGADGADGDPDHDGATNWEEFRAGTLPRDAGSYYGLRIGWNPQGGTIITANGLPNTTYTLQYCDQLGQPWKFLTPMATDNAGHAVFYVFLLASDQRYFRLSSP